MSYTPDYERTQEAEKLLNELMRMYPEHAPTGKQGQALRSIMELLAAEYNGDNPDVEAQLEIAVGALGLTEELEKVQYVDLYVALQKREDFGANPHAEAFLHQINQMKPTPEISTSEPDDDPKKTYTKHSI